jgi:hypothetical protein
MPRHLRSRNTWIRKKEVKILRNPINSYLINDFRTIIIKIFPHEELYIDKLKVVY